MDLLFYSSQPQHAGFIKLCKCYYPLNSFKHLDEFRIDTVVYLKLCILWWRCLLFFQSRKRSLTSSKWDTHAFPFNPFNMDLLNFLRAQKIYIHAFSKYTFSHPSLCMLCFTFSPPPSSPPSHFSSLTGCEESKSLMDFWGAITMETGSATRVYKSSSCVGGTARGGAFLPPLFNCADREREATKS